MPNPAVAFVAIAALWCLAALTAQVWAARGGGRRDFSRPQGNPARGVLYNFTYAMLPWNKETARLHPGKLAVGVLLHVGVFWALARVALLTLGHEAGRTALAGGWPLGAAGLVAGLYLLVRRAAAPELRAMSAPDDYLAAGATCGLLAVAGGASLGPTGETVLLWYTGALLAYLPLGKLRHAVFFFVARADYGRRLGYRGVYPPAVGHE